MAVETRYNDLKFGDVIILRIGDSNLLRISWGELGYVNFNEQLYSSTEEGSVAAKFHKANPIVSVVGNIGNELKHLQALLDETFLEE